jgi:hypothetical protein
MLIENADVQAPCFSLRGYGNVLVRVQSRPANDAGDPASRRASQARGWWLRLLPTSLEHICTIRLHGASDGNADVNVRLRHTEDSRLRNHKKIRGWAADMATGTALALMSCGIVLLPAT